MINEPTDMFTDMLNNALDRCNLTDQFKQAFIWKIREDYAVAACSSNPPNNDMEFIQAAIKCYAKWPAKSVILSQYEKYAAANMINSTKMSTNVLSHEQRPNH